MYISSFQGLTASDFVSAAAAKHAGAPDAQQRRRSRYPFDAQPMTFYRARNAIYYLFKALKQSGDRLTVLMPDYNSGNEVLALKAAGATVRYCPVGRDGQMDVADTEQLCDVHQPDVLYVIHYLGWPQPIQQLADLAQRRGMWLVEDCALGLLSDADVRPLGTFGHWSVFCLYKTLPLPNGACLVENTRHLAALDEIDLRDAGLPSVIGRTAELVVRNIRSRSDSFGAAMASMKRAAGRAAGAMDVPRAKVGDLGFDLDDVDLAMSDISTRLLKHLDLEDIRTRRIANYQRLARQLRGFVTPLHAELPAGACPLVYPILVADKGATADRFRSSGIDVLEFWNYGAEGAPDEGSNARYLRAHVLGLPIHQDLNVRHIDYIADRAAQLNLRMS